MTGEAGSIGSNAADYFLSKGEMRCAVVNELHRAGLG